MNFRKSQLYTLEQTVGYFMVIMEILDGFSFVWTSSTPYAKYLFQCVSGINSHCANLPGCHL